ncbi:MAG: tetratricopeptide repeat protein [Chitinophagaceae bacterium]|nr:tetratricopeptide repeat protein [Chitinophagaceae bacterium]
MNKTIIPILMNGYTPTFKECIIIFFLQLILINTGLSQPPKVNEVDSILNIIKSGKDTSAISAYAGLSNLYYFKGQQDSAIYYSGLGIKLSKANKNYQLTRLLLGAARCYYMKSINDSALLLLAEVKPFLEKENTANKLMYNTVLASVYLDQSRTDEALQLFIQSATILELPENNHLKHKLFGTYANIGQTFLREKEYNKAEEYLNKAMKMQEYAENKAQLIQIYHKYFIIYSSTNQLDKGKVVMDSAMAISNIVNNLELKQAVFVNFGRLYELRSEYQKAKDYYLIGLKLTDSINNNSYRSRILNNLSSVSNSLNQMADAEKFAVEALRFAKEINSFEDLNYAYGNLKLAEIHNGNYKQALAFAQLEFAYADSLSSTASKENVRMLEAKYEKEKKEKEIADLKLINAVKELAIIKRNRLLITGSITASALLLIITLLYRSSRQKRIIAEKDKTLKDEQIKFLKGQQQVVSLQSMVNGQETERTRIAKDLHDGLGGLFSTIKMHFSSLQHENENLKKNPLFSKSYDMVNTASEEVRRIAHNMMPEVLIKLGLEQATQELCNSISAGKLLQVSLQSYGMGKRLNASTEIMLFRIMQELLNNIIKHANATEAIIQFNRDGNRLSVTVEDNGRGFNMQETDDKTHAGLESVQNRVTYLNGKFSIESQKEIGTTVMMDFLINE